MNYGAIRAILVHAWRIPSVRIAFFSTAALTLLTAGLMTIRQPSAAGAGAEIRATGTFESVFSPSVSQVTDPLHNVTILTRYNVNTYTGSLNGKAGVHQTISRDDEQKKSFLTNVGTFWGKLEFEPGRAPDPGSFSFIVHLVADLSNPSVITTKSKFVVVEGTGMGGLEGICGGGTQVNTGVPPASYDLTFRFGSDCKANN